MDQHTDIVIVGAGLVGATLACGLAQADASLRILVLEASPELPEYSGEQFDPRVVALSPASVAILEGFDAWAAVQARRVCPYRAMSVWDGEGSGSIRFHSDEIHADNLGYIVENSVVVAALREQMAAHDNIVLRTGHKVVDLSLPDATEPFTRCLLQDGTSLTAKLLVAADGANSVLRELAGFATRGWDYQQSAIVTTVTTERPHEYTAWQRFSRNGPLALLPLSNDRAGLSDSCFSSIVWSLDCEMADQKMALSDDDFRAALGAASEFRLGQVTRVDQRYLLPLRQKHAVDYIKPGFALVGDAAHSIHPLAGQGVNLGLYDADTLIQEVARARKRGVNLEDHSILKRYQRTRKTHNLAAMAAMEGFKRLFGSDNLWLMAARNRGLHWADKSSPLKRLLIATAAGRPLGF